MGRKKLEHEGKRITIFLHTDQLEYIDSMASASGVTRSVYIQNCCLPVSMRRLESRIGDYGKGEKKGE